MRSRRLSQPTRARPGEPRRRHHHIKRSPASTSTRVALPRRLVDVAGEDELGAASASCSSTRPRRASGRLRVRQGAFGADGGGRRRAVHRPALRGAGAARSIGPTEAARLVPRWPTRVDADNVELRRPSARLRRLPLALELVPGRVNRAGGNTGRRGRRERPAPAPAGCGERRNTFVLVAPPAVRRSPVAMTRSGWTRSTRLRRALSTGGRRGLRHGRRDVDQARWHSRGRLTLASCRKSRPSRRALRRPLPRPARRRRYPKQRRGEPLTMEEEAALGHWQRLSNLRKVIAFGAFRSGRSGSASRSAASLRPPPKRVAKPSRPSIVDLVGPARYEGTRRRSPLSFCAFAVL